VRICFLSTGPFTHIGAYLDFFRDAGHDVHFLELSPGPRRAVPVHACGVSASRWGYPLGMLRARAAIKKLKPDVVHAHYATSGGLAALVCGFRPTIVTAHGTDLTEGARSPIWRPLLRAVFARAACVNTVSAGLTSMAEGLGVPRRKIAELTPGVDTARFRAVRAPFAGGVLRLICTRRFEPVYGHRTIIEALALVKASGVEVRTTFAGEGSLRGELEALAARRGLGASVSFVGEARGDAMPALLRAHDAYLSASRADGTSLSLLEAMASGLFPIVSRIPANEAWLEQGAGRLFEPGAPEDLAAGIRELARRPEAAASAAGINRAKVAAAGDRATNMRRLEGIYTALTRNIQLQRED